MILVEVFDSEEEDANMVCLMTFENSYKFDTFFGNCSFDEEMTFNIVDYETLSETLQ